MTARTLRVKPRRADIPGRYNPLNEAWSYWVDAWQRGVLFLDVMQRRSKQYEEHAAKVAPHVLKFGTELVMDGRKLPRPVNYVLARLSRRKASRSTTRSGHSSSSIHAPATGPASAGSRPRARSASPSRLGIPAISSAFCPSRYRDRPLKTSSLPRRRFSSA